MVCVLLDIKKVEVLFRIVDEEMVIKVKFKCKLLYKGYYEY